MSKLNFVFFGTTGEGAIFTLEALKRNNFLPALIVTTPDRPVGRNHVITPPPVKVWAEANKIPVLQPEKITPEIVEKIKDFNFDVFVVAAYGKILPQKLLDLAPNGFLNVHPSLLPLHRGPAPVEGAILSGDTKSGVTIIKLDAEVDHGPIITAEDYQLSGNETAPELAKILFDRGGELLAKILPQWSKEKLPMHEQDHNMATFTKKFKKEDGEISLSENPVTLWQKFRAHEPWPGTFFFKDGKRIKITKARHENDSFTIERVIPEGKKEISYEDYLRSNTLK